MPSLFRRLFGESRSSLRDSMDAYVDDEHYYDEVYDDEDPIDAQNPNVDLSPTDETYDVDGQLAVDVYDVGDAFLIKTMTAGVRKEDLEIVLTREQVKIRGSRYDDEAMSTQHYSYQELYWGTFARTIELPEEVDIDRATASESHGLLTLKLPKVDVSRTANLKIV